MYENSYTARQRRYLFGYIYIQISEYIGEKDIRYIHRLCMERFAPTFYSLKEMDNYSIKEYIRAIIIYFNVEHNMVFMDYELY